MSMNDDNTVYWQIGSTVVGNIVASQNSGKVDASWVKLASGNSVQTLSSGLTSSGYTSGLPLYFYGRYNSGSTSIKYPSLTIGSFSDMAIASYTSQEGDSGGALTSGTYAAGIHKGDCNVGGVTYRYFSKHPNIINAIG